MAKDPALLFYTADFLTGTMTMTNEHVGMYIKLLCLQHQKGRLAEIDMLYICNTHVAEVYDKFSKDEHGLYYNNRLETEALRRVKYSESRKKNVSKRWDTYVKHMETETITDNEDTPKKKSKPNTKFVIPNAKEVSGYMKEIGFLSDPNYFLDYQEARDWRLKGGQKIKSWKAVLRTWKKSPFKEDKPLTREVPKIVLCGAEGEPEDGLRVVCISDKGHPRGHQWSKTDELIKTA